MPSSSSANASARFSSLLGFLVAGLVCIPRIAEFDRGRFLWAEDGNVFIAQARDLGIWSIVQPYASYFHAYPRSIALLSAGFDVPTQAVLFVAAWFLCLFFLARTIHRYGVDLGLSTAQTCLLIALVVGQPSSGEVYFNITNAQWLLGAALTILIAADRGKDYDPIDYVIIAIGLTSGPFALLLAPIVVLRLLVGRDSRSRRLVYAATLVAGLVQIASVWASSHYAAPPLATPPDAARPRTDVRLSGEIDIVVACIAYALLVASFVVDGLFRPKVRATPAFRTAIIFLTIASYEIAASSFWRGSYAHIAGTRYSWVPYALVVLAGASLTARSRPAFIVASILLVFVSVRTMRPIHLDDVQLASYDAFARIEEVSIPINPRVRHRMEDGDEWKVPARVVEHRSTGATTYVVPASGIVTHVAETARSADAAREFYIEPVERIRCDGARHVGVRFRLSMARDSAVEMSWSQAEHFADGQSLVRFYPAGNITADFAFPNVPQGSRVRLAPSAWSADDRVVGLTIYCIA